VSFARLFEHFLNVIYDVRVRHNAFCHARSHNQHWLGEQNIRCFENYENVTERFGK